MELEDLRLAVYRSFAEHGWAPDVAALAPLLQVPPNEVADGVRELARQRHWAVEDNGGEDVRVVLAHPFSAVPLGFAVMGPRTLWWGGCAWDSFAIPQLVPDASEVLVSTRCPACAAPHVWNVTRDSPPEGKQVAHFLVPAAHIWDDVVHSCGHQRIFCSVGCIELWLEATGNPRGDVLDLAALWRLARHWYDGRLERGYTRRDPSESADYLRSVGLSGPFWGL